MHTQPITFDRAEARELWRRYKEHKHYSAPLDAEIAAIYQRIAQGRTVIRAIASIIGAGLYPAGHAYAGLPKLAIAPAGAREVYWRPGRPHHLFTLDSWARSNQARSRRVDIPWAMWRALDGRSPNGQALVPQIPLRLRPKRGLANYHILWEAEWHRVPPCDPILLRRIGAGDAWLVVAAWDLTEVERAALATRMYA